MGNEQEISFDFDFGGESRQEMFQEALDTLVAMDHPLGAADDASALSFDLNPEQKAAADLLGQLKTHVAELGYNPQMLELKEKTFEVYGWAVPKQFRDLHKTHRFFWMQVPVVLSQLENMPFSKLELAIEFNPAEPQPTRKPISVLIFPDKRIKQIAKFQQGASLKVGENFELVVATPDLDLGTEKPVWGLPSGGVKGLPTLYPQVKAQAGVDLGASGGFSLALGPFDYDLKKLELEHTDLGNSKVFWKVFTAKYLHVDRPQFIVVFQVPRQVTELKVAAAMQAYHQFDAGAAGLTQAFKVFREKVANFFRQGAPLQDTTVWELTEKLTEV
jgi:hypothetical protein